MAGIYAWLMALRLLHQNSSRCAGPAAALGRRLGVAAAVLTALGAAAYFRIAL